MKKLIICLLVIMAGCSKDDPAPVLHVTCDVTYTYNQHQYTAHGITFSGTQTEIDQEKETLVNTLTVMQYKDVQITGCQ